MSASFRIKITRTYIQEIEVTASDINSALLKGCEELNKRALSNFTGKLDGEIVTVTDSNGNSISKYLD